MNIEQLKARYQELLASAKDLTPTEGSMSAEDTVRVDELLAEAKGVDSEIKALESANAVRAHIASAEADLDAMPSPQTISTGSTIEVKQDNRENDPLCGFASDGEFYQAVALKATSGVMDERFAIAAAASGSTGSNLADGGALIAPPATAAGIYDGLQGTSDSLMDRVTMLPIGNAEKITMPRNGETSRANGSRWGGVRGYWVDTEEGQAITESNPKVGKLELEPKEVAALVSAPDKSLRNSAGALQAYINLAAPDELNFQIGRAFTTGTGAGEPLGYMNSGSLVTVAKEAGQTAATIVAANIDKMYSRLSAGVLGGAVWTVSQDSLPQLDGLEDGNGNALFRPGNSLVGAPHGTLKGLPILVTEYNDKLGDLGDICLVNFRHYAAAAKGPHNATSIHVDFNQAKTSFRFIMEVDGDAFADSPITPHNGSGITNSAFVALALRA